MSSLSRIAFGCILLLGCAARTWAQCPEQPAGFGNFGKAAAPAREPLLPESGFLSDTTYTSQFFGFTLELPINAQGHLIMLPLTAEKQHALLAIGYQNGAHSGSLTIDAVEPRGGLEGLTADQQQQRMENSAQPPVPRGAVAVEPGTTGDIGPEVGPVSAQVGPQVMPPLAGYKPPQERFHSSTKHNGEKRTATYWTRIKNYRVGVMVESNDKDFLQQAKHAMDTVRFYCTQDDGTLTTPDGHAVKPAGEHYQGPSVPTWRVNAAIQKKPGLQIDPGEVRGGVYRNTALGVQYELPRGWDVLPANNSGDPPKDEAARREFDFLHACSRTLLRAAQPANAGAASGPRSMITLRALDPVCLSLPMPASLRDSRIAEEVGAHLEARLEFGQIASSELVNLSNQLFVVLQGTIVAPGATDNLAQRMAQELFVTRHNKMVLVWSFVAPTSADLSAVPASTVAFDGAPAIELRAAIAGKK